ncbi:MAG: AAA family ATPase, partial [Candidatus Eremiobacteraeota bacterium]|nr:AAA family ATPase [Candidatus Eremiobacteraeota bacterium]
MILHNIKLSGFRTFADEIEIGPFSSNITVIHAPNATGKSTVLDGFYHGLLEKHTLTGKQAEANMRSRGRTLIPTVSVDFETNGVRYRLDKSFLDRPSAKLWRLEDGRFVSLHEGEAAAAFPRELLHAKPTGNGPMKPKEHFGLGAILWAAQGRIEFEGVNAEALGTARSLLGGVVASDGGGDVAAAAMAQQWFAKFYASATKETTKSGSANLPGLRKLLGESEKRFTVAQAALDEVDRLRLRYEESGQEKVRYAALTEALDKDLAEMTTIIKAFDAASLEKTKADADCATAEDKYEKASTSSAHISKMREAKTAAERAESLQATARDRATAEESVAREQLAHVQEESRHGLLAVEAAEKQEAIAQEATIFVSTRRELSQAKAHLCESEKVRDELQAVRKARIDLNAPTSLQMRSIRKLGADISDARTQLDAAILHIVFSPTVARDVRVIMGSLDRTSSSGTGTVEFSGSPVVEFEIDGVGTIRAHGPTASAEAIRDKLSTLKNKFAKLAFPFGTQDIAELERRAELLVSLEHKVENLESRLAHLTTDFGSIEDLAESISNGTALLDRLELTYPDLAATEPNAEVLAKEAKEALSAARGARSEAAT